MPNYLLGSAPPKIKPDPGSGAWCSAPQTAQYLLYKRALEMAMDTHGLDVTIGVDAVRHMRHYLNNTGNDYTLNMPELLGKSAQLRSQYDSELALAKAFAQTLRPGRYAMTSGALGHGYFRQRDDTNLFFAIGGYSYWGQGAVQIDAAEKDEFAYTLDFDFHFYDRYNWDGGKSVRLAGITITDEAMQRFHQQCYAKEFDVRGVLRKRVAWRAPRPVFAPETVGKSSKTVTPKPALGAKSSNPFAILMQ